MAQVAQCNECGGSGEVIFTKEKGGPVCNNCAGRGYMTRKLVQRRIATILDLPSIYMGGASHGNMRRADQILSYLEQNGMQLWATDE